MGKPGRTYPFELLLPTERTGLDRDRKAQPQDIRHLSTACLRRSLGHLPADLMTALEGRVKGHLGMN